MKKTLMCICTLLHSAAIFATTYYIRPTGNNNNIGTSTTKAWLDLTNINSKTFVAGDIIYFEQGFTYSGSIYFDPADGGTGANPITVSSWNPNGAITSRATINSGNSSFLYAYNTAGVKVTDLNIKGTTSSQDGISFYCDLANDVKKDFISIQNMDVSGYKTGISIGSWNKLAGYTNVTLKNLVLHDNVRGGVGTYAENRLAHRNVQVSYCVAYNNFGDLTVTTTNTGSGIVLSGIDGGKIDHCIAYDNGKNNRNPSGGPVGIWCYEANNIIMEYNESYNNFAGLNADGGGFDIDGGSTNCIMQYNYSHNNEGAGFLFAQFSGSSVVMNNNICRYNLSVNDGRKNSYGGITIWAASGFSISNTYIYGNTIYTSPASTGSPVGVYVIAGTNTTNTLINNNLFVTTSGLKLINAVSKTGISLNGNGYWPSAGTFSINWAGTNYSSLTGFKGASQESNGLQADPKLNNPGAVVTVGNTDNLSTMTNYLLKTGSPMIDAGITLTNTGLRDFYGNTVPIGKYDIGSHEFGTVTNISSAEEHDFYISNDQQNGLIYINGLLTINDATRFHLYNSLGKVIDVEITQVDKSTYTANTQKLGAGIYILEASNNGTVLRKKFLVQK